MKTEWKKCKLSSQINLIGGGTPKTSVPEYWNGEIPWLSVKDFNDDNRYVYKTEKYITQAGLEHSSTTLLQKDDIIISARGTVGEMAMIPFPMAFNQSCYGIRGKENNDQTFIYYLIKNSVRKLKAITHGSVFDTITRETFDNIEVIIPPLPLQKKIAGILKSLDDKIELNRQISKNLEEQAQCLFNEQFDKANDLLPDGWQIADIYSIANVIYGAPFASNLFNTEGNGKSIIRIRDLQSQNFTTYTTENHPKGYLLQRGDIVVGMDGEFRPYIWGNDEAWLNQRICVFENKRPKGKFFLYFTLLPLLNFIEETEMATTVIHIGKKDFDAFRIILPDEKTLNKYDELTMPMFEQIVANKKEITKLAQIRDTILPKLMSGEIEV